MQQNLSKFRELQREQEESAKLAFGVIGEVVAKEELKKSDEPKGISFLCDSPFIIIYQKSEEDRMLMQKKDFMDNINVISKYNNHMFIQYLGVQTHQYKEQPIKKVEEKEKKDTKKEAEKKNDKKQEPKKEEAKVQTEKKENEKKEESKENASALVQPKIKLKVFTQEKLQKLQYSKYKKQIKSKNEFIQRFNICFEVLSAVSSLHDLQYAFYPNNLQELVFLKNNSIKFAIHNTKLWRLVTQDHINETKAKEASKFKKQSMLNPSLKYTSPEFVIKSISIKDIRLNDIWKTGVFLITLLTGEDLSKDLLALQTLDEAKVKQHKLIDESKTLKLKKYLRPQDASQIMKLVAIMPSERPPLKTLKQVLQRIKGDLNEFLDQESLQLAKGQYAKEKAEKSFKFLLQLKANQEILTADHRKKLSEYFKTVQQRPVKDFKLLYRASQTQFSCKAFYEIAFQKKSLIIVFCEKANNKKIICYSEQAFDLGKCIGVFGGYIKDSKKLSFIFSPQENEFCKLKNADRAIGVSHTQGPIIGDGDFVVSDGGYHNVCKFPLSYESLKLKKLLKTQRFELLEYDVYQVLF